MSLDAARRQLAIHGEALLHETLRAIGQAREKLASVPGIALAGEEFVGRPGVADWDPLRIVLDVRGTGCTGYEVAEALEHDYDVQTELATQATVVLLVGLAEQPVALERVAGDVEEVVKRISRPGTIPAVIAPPATLGEQMAVPPRDAFLGEADVVAGRGGGRPHLLRVDRRLPAGHPRAAAGRADHAGDARLPARTSSRPARGCTARATRRCARSTCCASAPSAASGARRSGRSGRSRRGRSR